MAKPDLAVRNARIFTADERLPWAQALAVRDGRICWVGDDTDAPDATEEIDAGQRLVLPGFVDGHAHVLMMGEAQMRAHLTDAADLAEIQRRVREWADDNPNTPRVLGRGWLFSVVPGGRPTRQLLDAVVADRPVYLDANDYHSVWVNSAALAELGITRDTPDPVGGRIERDEVTGEPTGHLVENAAVTLVWPFLAEMSTDADRDRALSASMLAYTRSGVTCAVDMAMDEYSLAAMKRAEAAGSLTLRVAGHWLIHREGDHLAQVARAAELARTHRSDRLRITGVKFIVDGVIDGCTATMLKPYADGGNADPIWDFDALAAAVTAADATGLQVALHAIGDGAVRLALDALEHAARENGSRPRRHRIEHLEYVDPVDVPRIVELGVTASMQPVHADPAIRDNWAAMLGDTRAERGFAWTEITAAGARLALGTDAPTAPHPPLPNMFIASTRRSAMDPGLPALQPHFALPLAEAITHATADSAWACRAEGSIGQLRTGLRADFVLLDSDPFDADPDALLRARVQRTVLDGTTLYPS